jgi:hypothetical protein
MLIEALGCFGPLALGWYLMVFDQPGIAHYSLAEIEHWYLPQPGGLFLITMLYAGSIVGLIGPIGLFLGLRYFLSGRALNNRLLGTVLISAPIALNIGGWIAGTFYGPPDFRPVFDAIFVFTCLSIAGIAHLMYLARPARQPPSLAGA